MTGRLRSLASAGAKTFRYRQSSDVGGEDGCAQCGAKLVASRTPRQGAAGLGGCQRSAPTGGAAYGMPRYSAVAPAIFPRTEPSAVRTTRARLELWPGEAGDAAAQAVSVAEARRATAVIRIRVLKPMGRCSHPRRRIFPPKAWRKKRLQV